MKKAVCLISFILIVVLLLSAISFSRFFLLNTLLLTIACFKCFDYLHDVEDKICYNKNNRGN